MDNEYLDSDTKMWNRLYEVLGNPGENDLVYVYRVNKFGRPIKPYLTKFWLDEDLIWRLQTEFGGGLYRLLIRSGRVMRFSGTIGVEPLPNSYRRSAF